MEVEPGKGYEAKGDGFAEKGDLAYVTIVSNGIVYFWLEHPRCKYTLSVEGFKKRFSEPMEVHIGRTYKALKSKGHIKTGDVVRITRMVKEHKRLSVTKKGSNVELPCPLWLFKRCFIEIEKVSK